MHITLCYTQTLDGQLATLSGESQWIGAGESLAYWHQLRAEHAAVLVGVGTVLADNPRLTVRHVVGRDPLRVVVDSTLRTPLDAAVLVGDAAHGTLIATTEHADPALVAAIRALGATVLPLPTNAARQVDLVALVAALAARGIGSLMVEGGAQLLTALLRERLATRAVICVAPRLLGSGLAALGDLGIRRLADTITLDAVQLRQFGPDVVFDGRLRYSGAGMGR